MFVRNEAVLSSQIEGTQASLNDIIKAEAKVNDKGRPGDIREVRNYVAALNAGVDMLDDLPISTRLITQLHAVLMDDVRGQHQSPGELRSSQNWIGPAGCTLSNALFVPPPPQEVNALLGALENILHAPSPMPPLIRIGLIHSQFETIHPFLDGNGRVGRLIIALFLVEQTILERPVLYLSYYFKQHRSEYYRRLQAVRDEGDWESWLTFFLEGVATVSNLAAETAKKVLRLRESDRNAIITRFERSAAVPLRVLDSLYRLPTVTPTGLSQEFSVSYPTANAIVTGLEELGILREVTGQQRNRGYVYERYTELFTAL